MGETDRMEQPMSDEQRAPLPEGITPALVEETRATFQPYYEKPLTDADCIEMIVNVYRLFDMLYGTDQQAPSKASIGRKANDARSRE